MFATIIAPEALRERLGDAQTIVVDCRHMLADFGYGRREYDRAHIPGAFFADVESDLAGPKTGKNGRHPLPSPQEFAAFLRSLGANGDTQLVAYDDGADMFAPRFWFMCRWIGHDAVAVLDGGWKTWVALGYPMTNAVPARPENGTLEALHRPEYVVDTGFVLAHHRDPSVRLLDARAEDRFAGENETVDPVAGHIPGAHNHWFKRNFDESLRWRPAERLQADYAAAGDPAAVVHTCGSGVSSAANLLAMEHAGLHGSRIYGGSWSEWIADPTRPIATGPS